MYSEYAPIILFVYNREDHFKKTYEALADNSEAKFSDLYIFSDGPKSEYAEANVRKVRELAHSYSLKSDFKSVNIIESPQNKGLAASVIFGVTEILKKYDRAIVIEDDNVSSPYLLNFLNKALDYYKDNKRVGSIGAFCPSIKFPPDFNYDVFSAYRSCSCCWGIWADRWQNIDWELKKIYEFYKHPSLIRKLNSAGSDRFLRLYRQSKRNTQSWSVRFGADLVRRNLLTVYPRYSYVMNIGMDNSGVHSTSEDSEIVKVDLSNCIALPDFEFHEPDKRIIRNLKKHYSGGFLSDLKRLSATIAIILKEGLFYGKNR